MKNTKTTLTDTILAPSNLDQPKVKTEQNDLSELFENTPKVETNLPILQDPKFLELKKQFGWNEEFEKYLENLATNYWFDKEKLDQLYEQLVEKKVEEVLQKIQENWYNNDKLDSLLWQEVVEKMELVKWKVEAIKEWTLIMEEQIKQIYEPQSVKKWVKWIWNLVKWLFKIWRDSVKKEYKRLIYWTENKLKELQSLKPEIENIVEKVAQSEKDLTKSAEEYYRVFIALSFLNIAYEKIVENQNDSKNEFIKAKKDKELLMVRNRITQIKTSKVLLESFSLNHLKLSEKLDLIVDNLEKEYTETLFTLAITLDSLISQQKVREWVELWNFLQDLKNASIKNYFSSSRDFNDQITTLFGSANNTTKIVIEELKALNANIKENDKKIAQIEEEWKLLTAKMQKAAEEYKQTVYKSLWKEKNI